MKKPRFNHIGGSLCSTPADGDLPGEAAGEDEEQTARQPHEQEEGEAVRLGQQEQAGDQPAACGEGKRGEQASGRPLGGIAKPIPVQVWSGLASVWGGAQTP